MSRIRAASVMQDALRQAQSLKIVLRFILRVNVLPADQGGAAGVGACSAILWAASCNCSVGADGEKPQSSDVILFQ